MDSCSQKALQQPDSVPTFKDMSGSLEGIFIVVNRLWHVTSYPQSGFFLSKARGSKDITNPDIRGMIALSFLFMLLHVVHLNSAFSFLHCQHSHNSKSRKQIYGSNICYIHRIRTYRSKRKVNKKQTAFKKKLPK